MISGRRGVARGESPVPACRLGCLGEEVGLGVLDDTQFVANDLIELVFRARAVRYFEQVDVCVRTVQEALLHPRVVSVVYHFYCFTWGIGSQLDDDLARHEATHDG